MADAAHRPTPADQLRVITRYYEHHVLAWYALRRAHQARAVHGTVRELRNQLSTSDQQR